MAAQTTNVKTTDFTFFDLMVEAGQMKEVSFFEEPKKHNPFIAMMNAIKIQRPASLGGFAPSMS